MTQAKTKTWRPIRPEAFVLISMALMAFGLIIVASATVSLDRPLIGSHLWRTPFGRQILFVAGGGLLMFLTIPVASWLMRSARLTQWTAIGLFGAAILLLIAALIPGIGDPHRGSSRWLHLAPLGLDFGFQPSEVAKLALIGFLAWMLGLRKEDPRAFVRGLLPIALAAGVCVGLVGKENLGTAALLALVTGAMLLAGGCRILHLSALASAGVAGLAVLLFTADYRMNRVTAFLDIWADPQGAGYQPIQSLTSIATGGWQGVGLGSGIQKLGYLPESHTDFVFAILCEETGLVGAGLVIALFCTFAWLGLRTMLNARTPFERLLAFGLTLLVTAQAALNIAVVTVVVPTTGVPLPMLSAGGSGLITVCIVVGLLTAIARRNAAAETEEDA